MVATKELLKLLKELTSSIRKREISRAKRIFTKIIEEDIQLTKDTILQIYDLGETFRIYKDTSFFLSEIDKRITKYPTTLLYLIKLEIMYSSYDDKKEVLRVCDEALRKFPDYPEFLNMKSNILLQEIGKKDEALETIERALGIEPENQLLLDDKRYIEFEEDISETDKLLHELKRDMKDLRIELKNVNFQ